MPQFNAADAMAHLSELTRRAVAGEDIVIARDNQAFVRLVPVIPGHGRCAPGSGRGQLLWMDPAFDATPDDRADHVK